MYHVELRQFPHNLNRFNLTEQELRALLEPWAAEKFVEIGERKWSPHQAKLTVLEGPQLGVEQMSMGRGWRAAQRQSADVTERVLDAAKLALEQAQQSAVPAGGAAASGDALALGVQLATLLGSDPAGLLDAWRAVVAESPGLAPSEGLKLAEQRLVGEGSSTP
jgi:hypothetical protein